MQQSGYSLSILQHIRKFGLTVPPFREGSPEEAWLLCTNPRVCILGKENNVEGKASIQATAWWACWDSS